MSPLVVDGNARSAQASSLAGATQPDLPFARAGQTKLIEGRVVAQDPDSFTTCPLAKAVDKQYEPRNTGGCVGLDDVKVVAYDSHRNIVATSLTYASDRATDIAHGYYYLHVPANARYRVEYEREGYKPTGYWVNVGRSGRGSRQWAGMYERPLATKLNIPKNQDHVFGYCDAIRLHFNLTFAKRPPAGYGDYPSGRVSAYVDGVPIFTDNVKEKWGGKIRVTLGDYFGGGKHQIKLVYRGVNYREGLADVSGSSAYSWFSEAGSCHARTTAGPVSAPFGPA